MQFHTVANRGDIPEGEGRPFSVEGKTIALFCVEGKYFAINDHCPHQGASLSAGYVEEGGVTCPWHAWCFSLEDGSWLDAPNSKVRCDSYEVRVQGNEIQIGIND